MRRRIFQLYGELRFLEHEFERRGPGAADDLRSQLDRLEERANHMRVPLAFRQLLYTLRLHIGLVRERNPRFEVTDPGHRRSKAGDVEEDLSSGHPDGEPRPQQCWRVTPSADVHDGAGETVLRRAAAVVTWSLPGGGH